MEKLRVRMYRQGLGDSFLLTFPNGGKPAHMLIDCGVLLGTEDAADKTRAVAENVLEVTGGKLDVLVATHEHWDHLSGFIQAQEVFEKLEIGEVWVAWTEDPADELGRELREKKKNALTALAAASERLAAADDEQSQATHRQVEGLLGFFGAASGRSVADAFQWVKDRDAKVRFLRPGDLLEELGVRVYVLGPPHDRALIKRSDPSKAHPEVYELTGDATDLGFLAALSEDYGDDRKPRPFSPWYELGETEAAADPLIKGYHDPAHAWRNIDSDWLGAAGPLALKLDSDTNNTSLVLAFELSDGRVLLFPGDAQVGNWLSWESVRFADAPHVTSADLLARTVLYKVGHHASHNATLREKGLELMTSGDLVAMIPVNREMAKKQEWNMPFPPLFERLEQKTKGRILDAEEGVIGEKPPGMPASEVKAFESATEVVDAADGRAGWIEYTIEV